MVKGTTNNRSAKQDLILVKEIKKFKKKGQENHTRMKSAKKIILMTSANHYGRFGNVSYIGIGTLTSKAMSLPWQKNRAT